MGYKTIVVGTDGSETASDAVAAAAELAAVHGARLVVTTAFTPAKADAMAHLSGTSAGSVASRQQGAPSDIQWALTDRGQADSIVNEARRRAKQAGAGEVVVSTDSGDPSDVLLGTAREFLADLVVVGSVGLTSHTRLLLGSVADAVLHHATCDVLVVQTDS